jgi:hypothetical protein
MILSRVTMYSEMRGNFLYVNCRVLRNPERNTGLSFAGHHDVDVEHLLAVGVDDDLVDELDQLVVSSG